RAGGVRTSAWSCGHEHGITDPPPSTESPSSLAFVTPSSSSPSIPRNDHDSSDPPRPQRCWTGVGVRSRRPKGTDQHHHG
ncbi:hypothetical protein M9458_035447, partial [Cirrhinus mrigala]